MKLSQHTCSKDLTVPCSCAVTVLCEDLQWLVPITVLLINNRMSAITLFSGFDNR